MNATFILVLVAALATSIFVALHRRHTQLTELATAALFLVGFGAGLAGALSRQADPDSLQSAADALLITLQLIVLNVSADESSGLWLGIARFALPLATAGLLLSALVKRADQWLLRLRFRAPEVLVLGCHKTSLRLLSSMHASAPDLRVLAIHGDLDSAAALDFRRRNIPVLVGAILSAELLNTLGLPRTSRIVICADDDRQTLTVAREVAVRLSADPTVGPSIVLCVESMAIARVCRLDPCLAARYESGKLEFLSAGHLDSRLLLQTCSPHRLVARSFGHAKDQPCHIAVYGEGALTDELIAQAARSLVYPAGKLRISVFVPAAADRSRQFFARFPALDPSPAQASDPSFSGQVPIAEVDFIETPTGGVHVASYRRVHSQHPIDVVYVVGEDNANVSLGYLEVLRFVHMMEQRPAVVCAYDPDELDFNGIQTQTSPDRAPQLDLKRRLEKHAHGVTLRLFFRYRWETLDLATLLGVHEIKEDAGQQDGRSPLPDAFGDEIAKRVWLAYEERYASPGAAPQTLAQWRNVPHDQKWWNRYSGDHAAIKYHLLEQILLQRGEHPSPGAVDELLNDEQILDDLAALEHKRYVSERMTDGWIRVNGDKLNDLHLNPSLVSQGELPESERQKDVEAARVQVRAAAEVMPIWAGSRIRAPLAPN